MNELSIITFSVLYGLLALYLVVFWGIGIASLVVSYIHDGEKDFKAFYRSEKWLACPFVDPSWGGADSFDVKVFAGILWPLSFWAVSILFWVIDFESGQPFTLYFIAFLASAYATLRIARAVTRIKKAFEAHKTDKKAHQ